MISSPIEELFFEITHYPLVYQAEPYQFLTVPRYEAIARGDDHRFLGVKSVVGDRPPLVFSHQTAYQLGRKLFYQLFRKEGEAFRWFGTEPFAWTSLLIGGIPHPDQPQLFPSDPRQEWRVPGLSLTELVEAELLQRNNRVFASDREETNWETDRDDSLLHRLQAMEPVIGIVNGFDIEDSLSFFLLVSAPLVREDFQTNLHQPPRPVRFQSNPLLTLASFSVNGKKAELLIKLKEKERLDWLQEIISEKVVPDFRDKLQHFVHLYDLLWHMPLDWEDMAPVVLDIYDKNRVSGTIRNDERLQHTLGRMLENLEYFFSPDSFPRYATILDYIMDQNSFDLLVPGLERKRVESIFERRKAYNNCWNRFPRLYDNPDAEQDYLRSQRAAFERVREILLGKS